METHRERTVLRTLWTHGARSLYALTQVVRAACTPTMEGPILSFVHARHGHREVGGTGSRKS
eukprot:10469014-Heterocapsa_arctica.AAC.1